MFNQVEFKKNKNKKINEKNLRKITKKKLILNAFWYACNVLEHGKFIKYKLKFFFIYKKKGISEFLNNCDLLIMASRIFNRDLKNPCK